MICEWCNMKFDKEITEVEFECENSMLSYNNIRKCLCSTCATAVISDEVEGVYYEICEKCGKEFDYIEENSRFDDNFSWCNGTSLTDYWNNNIQCCDCALKELDTI